MRVNNNREPKVVAGSGKLWLEVGPHRSRPLTRKQAVSFARFLLNMEQHIGGRKPRKEK